MRKLFITGIGTDVGKTIVSAILVEALKADYWKPIQAGIEQTDALLVKNLISNSESKIHPESFVLKNAMSPHAAAELEHVDLKLNAIAIPQTNNTLIIEGAGGLMVPLNEKELIVDLIQQLDAEVILVVQNYLGSINHSLLSIELLKQKKLKVLGIVLNGEINEASEKIILSYSGFKLLGRINKETVIDKKNVSEYAKTFEYLKEV